MLRLHPKYLTDARLLALWREGLNGQRKISDGRAWGDFVLADNPLQGVGAYLSFIASEGLGRGYKMNHELIMKPNFEEGFLPAAPDDLEAERKKLNLPETDEDLRCHPIYTIVH